VALGVALSLIADTVTAAALSYWPALGAVGALAIALGLILVLILLVLAIALAIDKALKRKARKAHRQAMERVASAAERANPLHRLEDEIGRHPLMAAGLALGLGALMSRKGLPRDLAQDLLRDLFRGRP